MSGASNASNQATKGSDSGYVPTPVLELAATKEMPILTISKYRLQYTGKPQLTHSLTNRELDAQYALRSYLQDQQVHEKLALRLQNLTANESIRRHE
jgi:hypothetical protein